MVYSSLDKQRLEKQWTTQTTAYTVAIAIQVITQVITMRTYAIVVQSNYLSGYRNW